MGDYGDTYKNLSGTVTLNPGRFTLIKGVGGDITLNSGLYCITGEVRMAGHESISGDGVVLYFTNTGRTRFVGLSWMNISAPTLGNCLGNVGIHLPSCNYVGMAVSMARSNTDVLETGANGTNFIKGTVYALNSSVRVHGGGYDPDEVSVLGQIIAKNMLGNGNGSYLVEYDENWIFPPPPDPPYLELVH